MRLSVLKPLHAGWVVDFYNFIASAEGKVENIHEFDEAFCRAIYIHAPLKVKMLRHSNSAFVRKSLTKTIMKRLRLKNLFNTQRTHENSVHCKMQRNLCINLLRKTKKKYFTNGNRKDIADSKTSWKTIKPNYNEKGSNSSTIILSEKGSILNDN